MGIRHAEGVAMGHARKRGERATGGCTGRRERRAESPLRDGQRGGDAGPPWGMARAKGEKQRPEGLEGGRTLGSGGGDFAGREASGVDPETHRVGGEGGREASGVEENPGGGRHGVGGGVKLVQDDLTPNGMGGGVESFRTTRLQTEWEGESSHLRTTRPPESRRH